MRMVDCISVRRLNKACRGILFLGFLALGTALSQGAPALTVSDVRFWSIGDVTRVAVEVSGEFSYRHDRLSKPDRLFFDISNASPGMIEKGMHTIAVGDGLLKQIRVAETKPGVTRIVLDLEDNVDFTSSQLSNPERLMIELKPAGASRDGSGPAKTEPPPPAPAPRQESKAPLVTKSETKAVPAVQTVAVAAAPAASAPAPPKIETAKLPALPKAEVEAPAEPPIPAVRNSNGDRSLTRVLGLKLGRIVIDPGHGGHDPGTHGNSGLLEKDLVLDISKRLAKLLEEGMNADVVLTRTDDTFIPLEERSEMANSAKADLFLSIHANSNPNKSVAGIETYYLNFSASREDLDLATRENASARTTIAELREVVSKIALRAKIDESREFAVQLHKTLHATARGQNKDVKDRPVKRAPFVVLIGAEMPSVLAEIGYLSNAREEALFKSDEYRDQIAASLYDGIAAYMKTLGQGPVASLE